MLALLWVGVLHLVASTNPAPVLGIDLGNEYFKVAAISPSHNLEMVLNSQSKRKTRTVANFASAQTRQFGEAAYALQTSKPDQTFQHIVNTIGLDVPAQSPNGFPSYYYPYNLSSSDPQQRFVKPFITDPHRNRSMYAEEMLAQILSHAKDLAKEHLKESALTDDQEIEAAVVIPVDYSYRQRQALRQAMQIAGIRPVAFVYEPLATAVSHALDLSTGNQTAHKVFLSIGSRNTQGCLVKFHQVPASTTVKAGIGRQSSKATTVQTIDTIACSQVPNTSSAAHRLDIILADHIVQKYAIEKLKAKNRERITVRNRRRLIKEVGKLKHTLSTNKDASLSVEGFVEGGKDLRVNINRATFEELIESSGWFDGIRRIRQDLQASWKSLKEVDANLTADAVLDGVELVGGGWRVPKVQNMLESLFSPANLSQKCNSDEAMAMGAAMVAANHSSTYKFRPLLLNIPLLEDLQVSLAYQDSTTDKATTVEIDFPFGTRFGANRKRSITTQSSVRVLVKTKHDNKILDVWSIDGADIVRKMKETTQKKVAKYRENAANDTDTVWHSSNATNAIDDRVNVSLSVRLNQMGLISIEKAVAGYEELDVDERTELITTTTTTAATTAATETKTNSTEGGGTTTTTSSPTSSSAAKKRTVYTEKVAQKSKTLTITKLDGSKELKDSERKNMVKPYIMSNRQIRDAKNSLRTYIKSDRETDKLNEMRNRLEEAIYGHRQYLGSASKDGDEVLAVVSSEEERASLLERLKKDEEWLYEEGFSASYVAINEKLSGVKEYMREVLSKVEAYRSRGAVAESGRGGVRELLKKMEGLKKTKGSWLNLEAGHEAIRKFEKWLNETSEAQEKADPKEKPILTRSSLEKQLALAKEAVANLSRRAKPKNASSTSAPPQNEEL